MRGNGIERGRLFLAAIVVIAAVTAAAYVQGGAQSMTAIVPPVALAGMPEAAVNAATTGSVPVRVSVEPTSVIAGGTTYVRVYLDASAVAGGQDVEMAYMTTDDDQDLLSSYTETVTVQQDRYVRRFGLSTVAQPDGGYISVVARIGNSTTSTVLKVDGAPQ